MQQSHPFPSPRRSPHVAVIGAGFAGLSVCYYLLSEWKWKVTLFDPQDIGCGTSGIAAGLLHPYPGKKGKLAWMGKEGLEATRHLARQVSPFSPIPFYREGLLRMPTDRKQANRFLVLSQTDPSFNWQEASSCFFLPKGLTIASRLYLRALWDACAHLGGQFVLQSFPFDRAQIFDFLVFATGAASYSLFPHIRSIATLTKGQILRCHHLPTFPKMSCIGNGYLAIDPTSPFCYLGSTYEHTWSRETPCLETAKPLILRKIAQWLPLEQPIKVQEVCAGFRISGKEKKYPIVDRINPITWVITGFGSRGLLYHAYLGQILAKAIATNNPLIIPEEVRIKL